MLCRDVDLALPADPDVLELRGDALWTHAICETPLEHWTVAMEAFAVALDDPFDAWHGERGDRIGLAFDLEWENHAGELRWTGDSGYRVACTVNGDLQVGDESWTSLSAAGHRWHSWGIMAPFAAAGHGTNTAGHRVAYLVPSRDGPVRARRQLRPDGTWTI